LFELAGHTSGNRLDVMAMKPAPIQITYIGYPNTTGLKQIDYRITDALCDPLDTTQKHTEKLIRLPNCFLCYTPPLNSPPVSPTPCLTTGVITFGSFNNLGKINDDVLKVWCHILRRIPNSKMILKCKPFASKTVQVRTWSKFEANGINHNRVVLLGLQAMSNDHLKTYDHVDISLDSWPYAGTTTTCEALWMGIPTITLKGQSHCQNVGVSLLTQLGLEELIANSEEEFINIAVNLATNIPKLAQIRDNMRPRMLQSPLCDDASFIKHYEKTLRGLWLTHCQNSLPLS
jgi:protein O-GlcNAc transferase